MLHSDPTPRRLAFLATLFIASWAGAVDVPTNFGAGADAEVRESNPTQNRGNSSEIASRISDRYSPGDGTGFDLSDRNSLMFLQFDLQPWTSGDVANAILRLTYRNNNLAGPRIEDQDAQSPDFGANGLVVYGVWGASFDEGAITYENAPGLNPDGDVGTLDISGNAIRLGEIDFPAIGTQNHLPVGGALDFSSALLDIFLNIERDDNPQSVAVLAVFRRNQGRTYTDPNATKPGHEPPDWANFNYLFNPKEKVTLNTDASYEADVGAPTGAGSPWSGADNSEGAFSPQLRLPGVDYDGPDINIDFGDAQDDVGSSFGGAAGTPGPWNIALIGANGLFDTNGQATGANLSLSAGTDGGSAPGIPLNDAARLLADNFNRNDGPWTVSITDLPRGPYRVYLYAPANSSTSSGDVDVDGILVPDFPGDTGELIEGTSWVSVDVNNDDGVLVLSSNCTGFCGLAGMQLEFLPEPGSSGLALGMGLLLALARRQRSARTGAAA